MDKDNLHIVYAIMENFVHILEKAQKMQHKPRHFGSEELLYSSEIHLIEIIGENDKRSVTELANLINITKGAVSQTVKKLENKNLIYKERDPENQSRIFLHLTEKGLKIVHEHREWHSKFDNGFLDKFYGLSKEKLLFLSDFIKQFENFLDVINSE